jgi:hypothetical protein
MRTFTKLCFVVFALTFSVALFAQQNIHNHLDVKAVDKMEMYMQMHGPTTIVPMMPEGTSKAIGDDCSEPIIIEQMDLPFAETNTTQGRGNNYFNTCLNDFDGGEDIIYELQLTTALTISVTLDPKGTAYSGMALSDGCPGSVACLAISYDLSGDGNPHGFTAALEAGTYYIMVDTWPGPDFITEFDIAVEEVTSVANDNCEDATPISELINLPFSTELATNDFGATFGPNIWFNYTAGFTGIAVIDLCGSDYDTYLAAWDGAACPVDYSTLIDENDDACGYDGLQSKIFLPVTTGENYLIEIGGFSLSSGTGLLSIYEYEVCDLTCPPGGIAEAEPCGDDLNGGCNMAVPAFINVTDGTTICGNLWSEAGERDTDWFKVELASPGNIKMNVETEETVIFGLVGQNELGVPGCNNIANFLSVYKILPNCQEDFIYVVNLPKGTYYLFIAPLDYFAHPCPGFSYIASFETVELETGFVSGQVLSSDGGVPLQGVVITAGDYSATTGATGNYLLELPVGTYTVDADGYNAAHSNGSVAGIVVNDGAITTGVNFILDPIPAPVLVSAIPDIEQVTLEWLPIGSKEGEGSKTLMGDIFSNNDYVPGATMDLEFTMQIYSPDFQWGEYAEMEFPFEFTLNSGSNLNGVSAMVSGQTISWSGLFLHK